MRTAGLVLASRAGARGQERAHARVTTVNFINFSSFPPGLMNEADRCAGVMDHPLGREVPANGFRETRELYRRSDRGQSFVS